MKNLETIIKTNERELIIKTEELTRKLGPEYRELIIGTLLDQLFAINKIDKETEEVISKIKDLTYFKISDISNAEDVILTYSKNFREIEKKLGLKTEDFSISYYLDWKNLIKNCVVATSLILLLAKENKNKNFGAIVIPSHAFSVYRSGNNYYPLDGNSFQIYSEKPFKEIDNLKISYKRLMEEKREKLKKIDRDRYLYDLNLEEDEISLLLYGKSADEFLQFILPMNSLIKDLATYDINESISFMVNLGQVVVLLDKDRGNLFINDPSLLLENFKVKDSISKNTSKLLQKLGTYKPNPFIVYNKGVYIKGELTQLNFNTGKLKAKINNTEFTFTVNSI
ncbi:MAG: hypothetical protein OH318_03020 [Candidatus Parvarchaeota archaeon]|nr:hypothetical protein [Candidatus Rehaiarchaeum fermentans]